jgi:ABC-2 type transport system ATP-binding protein
MDMIVTENLIKEFEIFQRREGLKGAFRDLFNRKIEPFLAVDNLNLRVKKGEVLGYIGANGAGKSTTIKMLTGILVPTSGKIEVNGMIPWKQRDKYTQHIGVVFGQRSQLWWDIAPIESFKLLQRVYRIPERVFRSNLNYFIEILSMEEFLHIPVRKLSLGQRMRCELAAALLHNPQLIFLDEPTIGLDVLAKARIREFLKKINEERETTIILTTHDISDIEALCSRVALIDKGKMIYEGTLVDLKDDYGVSGIIEVEFNHYVDPAELNRTTTHLEIHWHSENGYLFQGQYRKEKAAPPTILGELMNKYNIKDFSIEPVSTEEIVRNIYLNQEKIHKAEIDDEEIPLAPSNGGAAHG